MIDQIEAILFDMGGTLRSCEKVDPASNEQVVKQIMELIEAESSLVEFTQLLSERGQAYATWARSTNIELNEGELWTQWMLPDFPTEKIRAKAIRLNQLWREATGIRIVFPEAREVLLELYRRGYRLGLISNTVSSVEVPLILKEMNLSGCFEVIILSCVVGRRKPDPAIFLEATERMGILPQKCAYIGNLWERDVVPSRQAGFSLTCLLRDPKDPDSQVTNEPTKEPDFYIDNLKKLWDIFPPRKKEEVQPAYQTSLSTMWAIENFPKLTDFFEGARRLGFSTIELNHLVDASMFEGIDLSQYIFSSVHEPCPVDYSTDELKRRDWLVSSPNEENRKLGVQAIKGSIDLAHQLNVTIIVTHCGTILTLSSFEKKLRCLFNTGVVDSEEYQEVKQIFMESRAKLIGPHMDAVKKSLLELLDYASRFNLKIGLENRYHYYDIPSLDEMGELLNLGSPDQLGFIYDVGHAQTLDRMGFFPHEEWLRRYASRMIGVHLHDVIGINDHYAPGLGEVDFKMVASYLPENSYKVLEIQGGSSYQQIKAGLSFLVEQGCIRQIS